MLRKPIVRIGIDFDNTIVNYDTLFQKVALEQGVIPPTLAASKLAVRNHLRAIGKEDIWTEMQGYVYGARMKEAVIYPGVMEFFRWAKLQGISLAIVSHKTKYPFIGPQYDLQGTAREWAMSQFIEGERLIDPALVYFELTQDEKIKRIGAVGCDYFIDDLPEIFLTENFPVATQRILFDPDAHHSPISGISIVHSWNDVQCRLSGQWQGPR